MILGRYRLGSGALIRLAVLGPAGRRHPIEALIDTGFDGFLTLPRSALRACRLRPAGPAEATLADGTSEVFALFGARILWDRKVRSVFVLSLAGPPLVGLSLLQGHRLRVDFVDRGSVAIQPLSG